MSTHPNVILMLELTPDDLARKTYRAILKESGIAEDGENTADIKISGKDYHHMVMEEDYDDGWQIDSKEGNIVVFDLVTYGYGDKVLWADLDKQKVDLEEWAKVICQRHYCNFSISIGANYW